MGTPISQPIVVAKAKMFFEIRGLEGTFDASPGWLTRLWEIWFYSEKIMLQ